MVDAECREDFVHMKGQSAKGEGVGKGLRCADEEGGRGEGVPHGFIKFCLVDGGSRRIRGDLRRYVSAGSDEVAHIPVYIWFTERKGR